MPPGIVEMSTQRKKSVASKKPWYKDANTWKKVGQGALTVGKVASEVANLASLINVEFKAIYSNLGAAPTATGEVNLINGCVRGTDYNNRDGRSLLLKSVECKFDIKQNAAATKPTHLRIAFVLDKQPSGVIPSFGDIYDTSAGADYCTMLRNLTNRKRFVILKDEHINVDAYNPGALFEYYRKLNTHTIFNAGNAGTIADISEGSLYLVLASNATAGQEPTVTGNYRIRFIDN